MKCNPDSGLKRINLGIGLYPLRHFNNALYLIQLCLYELLLNQRVLVLRILKVGFIYLVLDIAPEQIKSFLGTG